MRDLTDQEFSSLTIEERKRLVGQKFRMKKDVFHPNLLLMNSYFSTEEQI